MEAASRALSIFIQCMVFFLCTNGEKTRRGEWGEWGAMSPCSVTCGSGTMSMQKVWMPGPDDPPSEERWTSTQVFSCTAEKFPECPQNGSWSGWNPWSGCSKPCGGGVRERNRECQGQLYGGKPCSGEKFVNEECSREPCPLLPKNFDMSQCKDEANFTCISKKMCIPKPQKCDSIVHCHDGSDEQGCPSTSSEWGDVRYDLSKSRNGATSVLSITTVFAGLVMTAFIMVVLH